MSVIKHKEQRVGVFLDVQNLYHSAKHLYQGARVNFKEVLREAVAGRKLIRALAYVVKTETAEEQAFFEALTKLGIELKVKDLQVFPGGMKKGDWDVGLAVDAIKLAPALDAIIIASGDGDFVSLIDYLKNSVGIQVEVMAFGRSASARLKESADDFVDLGEKVEQFIFPNKTKGYTSRFLGRFGKEKDF
ncbi:NYN domain-containing protein [Candidatus Parcubacteria bacterium]|nr:MAG: NYN domain-containing protein [Candidatus Parcubacteria bacterium]